MIPRQMPPASSFRNASSGNENERIDSAREHGQPTEKGSLEMNTAKLFAVGAFVALVAMALGASAAEPLKVDLYVAIDGRDNNPGTAAAPLASIARARDLLRPCLAAGMKSDLLVLIRGGTYRLSQPLVFAPEDSGTDRHTVTYAAAPGEKVVLSGGRKISGWRRGPGQIWTVELNAAQRHLSQLNPKIKPSPWDFRQLFVDGRRATRARTPNAGQWWKLRPRKNSDANDATLTLGVDHPLGDWLTPGVDHPLRAWTNTADVEVVWLNNNDGSRQRLGNINAKDNTFTLPPPHMWPHGLPFEYNIGFPSGAYSCYFENAIEMLDEPGEWYLDRQTGKLSYWPRPGEDMTRAEVIAPVVQNSLLVVAGTATRPVQNMRFQGLHVSHVDRPLPPYGFASQFGCLELLEAKTPEFSIKFRWIDAAVSFKYARHCDFLDGGISHAGGIGLSLLIGCAENTIEGNDIGDLGGGGIAGGALRNRDTWKWADPLGPEEQKGYRIANNHIHDCGADYFGAIGIILALTHDSVVAHNLIHDIAYAGIVLSGDEIPGPPFARNNTIAYNHIHDAMKVAVDGAGIYVSFPQADRGAAIRGNWIHDLRRNPDNPRDAGPWSAAGIYLDGVRENLGCRGYHFENNVVYGTDSPLFFCACSEKGNTWNGNVFQKAAPPKPVLDAIAKEAGLEPAYRQKLLAKP